MSAPDLSVVILSWNTRQLVAECLEALQGARDGLDVEVVVVDNGSHDGSPDMIAERFPDVVLEPNAENRGYAGGVNQGIARATGRRVCLLGSDTRVKPGTFRALIDHLDAHPEVGAVAPPLLNDDDSYQAACMRFPTIRTALWWDTPLNHLWPESKELRRYQMKDWDHRGTREIDQPPGTCFMVRREVLDEVGVMDERLWLFFNDVDWSLRIRHAGYSIWYVEAPGVYHHEGGSTRHFQDFAGEWHRNRIHFYRKHYKVIGNFITKTVLVYVAFRQCVRIKRDLPFGKEYWAHCRGLMGQMWAILQV
ncbi:MAG: hypothetical protein CMJ83_19200 [Planctomycetes bacterium]|nr:hypothetical protein [Planctomycetota bacterium]